MDPDAPELLESSSESGEDDHSTVDMCLQLASASTSNRFNLQQRAILKSHYRMGMVGTGKVHSF